MEKDKKLKDEKSAKPGSKTKRVGTLMDAEEILTTLNTGKVAWFQWTTFLKLAFVYTRGVWPVFGIMFLGAIPDYECALPDDSNSTTYTNQGECEILVNRNGINQTEKCTHGFSYGQNYDHTIVTDFTLTCDRTYLVELSTTIYMIGSAFGAALISPLSDKYGRKLIMLICVWIQGVIGVGTAFVDNYVLFVILRFCIGFLNMGIALITYIMATELFDARRRIRSAVGLSFFWASGIILLSLFAYLVPDWRHLQLLITVPNFITILYIWFLPDSIPWLVLKGRWNILDKMLRKAAQMNNITLPPHICASDGSDKDSQDTNAPIDSKDIAIVSDAHMNGNTKPSYGSLEANNKHNHDNQAGNEGSVLDLFRIPLIRRYTLVMFYLWSVISLSYFGILFSTPTLHGNVYINLAISGAVEIPAGLLCIFVLEKTGRKKPIICFLVLCGVMNIITIFVPTETASGTSLQWLIITLAMIGKFGITGAYSTVYLMSAEIFPTSVRNQAVGISSFFENSGTILAPFIVFWAKDMQNLPLVIFGTVTMVGGLLALLLPETHNQALKETFDVPDKSDGVPDTDVTRSNEPIVKL